MGICPVQGQIAEHLCCGSDRVPQRTEQVVGKRTEHDLLGAKELPGECMTGVHTARAIENFGLVGGPTNSRLIRAYGMVKLACARTNRLLGYLDCDTGPAIEAAAAELAQGELYYQAAPAALQGGAGTSTNMFVNELIANRALQILGKGPGTYDVVSPLEHVNLHQSTNDTYPTALRVAAIIACNELEQAVGELAESFQIKEREFADVVKIGRTQLQDAVLTTLGREMGAYAEAFSRDRWRLSKCRERLRVVNLGGTAIGTGLGAPRKYIFVATDQLRAITGLPLARAENLVQATQNCDDMVEVSGIVKAFASNLLKISNDIRLLSSGPHGGPGELRLPAVQAGSSIMPGKVNPVVAEMAGQVAMQAFAHDAAVTAAATNGQLELNAFMPCIAHNLLGMLDSLIEAAVRFRTRLVEGMEADRSRCRRTVDCSTAVLTSFVEMIGYEKATKVAATSSDRGISVKDVLIEEGICTVEEYERVTSPQAVLALGSRGGK